MHERKVVLLDIYVSTRPKHFARIYEVEENPEGLSFGPEGEQNPNLLSLVDGLKDLAELG